MWTSTPALCIVCSISPKRCLPPSLPSQDAQDGLHIAWKKLFQANVFFARHIRVSAAIIKPLFRLTNATNYITTPPLHPQRGGSYIVQIQRYPFLEKKGYTFLFVQTKFLSEFFHTSAGVNKLLLAGIERVTLCTDFNIDALSGGTGLERITAGTLYSSRLVIGMDCFSHFTSPLS